MSAGSEEGGAQGVPLGAVCGRSGFAGGEKYYIITYCQERRKWGIPKNILKKVKKVFDRGGGRVHKRALEKDDKGQLTLKITNPKDFWSVSKYLVIDRKSVV